MKHAVALLPAALLIVHCSGEPSVASKSAAAYREAQEKGVEIGGGHEHGGHEMAGTSGSAADAHEGHAMGTAGSAPDPHAGHTMSARAGSPALQQDPHAGHTMPRIAASSADPHAAHSGARATQPAPPPAAPVTKTPPTSSAEMRDLRPAATLQPDAFDAPAPASVSEAAKASGGAGAGHEGHKP